MRILTYEGVLFKNPPPPNPRDMEIHGWTMDEAIRIRNESIRDYLERLKKRDEKF